MSKKQPKLTPWFDPVSPPLRIGVYQVGYAHEDGLYYNFWNGSRFTSGWTTPKRALDGRRIRDTYRIQKWRGLAVKP